jgi:hypothetical protein
MIRFSGLALLLVLWLSAVSFGATKDAAPPDREMLRMMELLREMEMIKQIDMLQDMHNFDNASDQAKNPAPQKSASGKQKESVK